MYELISIITNNGTIIENIPNDLYIPEDLKRFYEITNNNIVVMGRKTFDTLKNPLKNRINIVITRNKELKNAVNLFYCNLDELENTLKNLKNLNKKVFIIGGGEIYNSLIDSCNILHLTIAYKDIVGKDKLLLDNINKNYKLVEESQLYYSTNSKCNYKYLTYKK